MGSVSFVGTKILWGKTWVRFSVWVRVPSICNVPTINENKYVCESVIVSILSVVEPLFPLLEQADH